jgi:ribose transport system ATP-binding protein
MLPIPANITLADLSQAPLYRRMRPETENQIAGAYIQDLDIVPVDTNRPVMYLSGGNQQKVVLARWLFSRSKVLIFDEPTRGIDVGAKAEVFALMNNLTQQGTGIIMISSEMLEILAMADRILVMRGGRLSAEFQAGTASQEKLLINASLTHGGSSEQAG